MYVVGQKAGYLDSQQSEQPKTQPSELQEIHQKPGYSDTQQSEQPKEKLAKRENPDYTQTTFRIPKKLSRQINADEQHRHLLVLYQFLYQRPLFAHSGTPLRSGVLLLFCQGVH